MDRQRLSQPMTHGGTTQCDTVCCETSSKVSTTDLISTEDLKVQILNQLPEMIAYQKECQISGSDISCKMNAKLLQYFIQKEFVDKKTQESVLL